MSIQRFDLTGRVALVTGSSRGIGNAIARGLAAAGATVVVNGRDRTAVDTAVEAIRSDGLSAHGRCFDVSDRAAARTAIEVIEANVGPVDILVNNAGIQRRAPLLEVDAATWDAVIETNLTAVLVMAQAVASGMMARERGKIINICSLMSEVTRPTLSPYTAAKGGVKMLTRSMCVEWARYNIQANGIGPGYFATEITKPLVSDPEFDAWIRQRTPAGRWGDVEELVGAAIFLASPASDFVNGQVIYVDGGVLATL